VAVETVGLLHPGEMGAAVGAVLRGQGHRVVWASEGRSEETRVRAESSSLEDVGSVAKVAEADVVFSICPPHEPGTTRLYLSGDEAPAVAGLFAGSVLDARVTSNASVVKMAYAAWTKGTAAMLIAIRELALREGVEATLLEEWDLSQPGLRERHERATRSAEAKGWRWVGEMEEIADTFEAAGLPGGFHRAAAEVYRRR
jgi:hypothetical protein